MKLLHLLISAAAATALVGLTVGGSAGANEPFHSDKKSAERIHSKNKEYSPWVDLKYPLRPLFGDTHLHTSLSFDAISFGTTITSDQAYQFARGAQVVSSTGVKAKLSRPLDFLVIADHAENMGTMGAVKEGLAEVMSDETVRGWNANLKAGGEEAMKPYLDIVELIDKGKPMPAVLSNKRMFRSAWEETIEAAERYNEPGRFTAFIGYEWSSNAAGNNLHRVVVYRDDADRAKQTLPITATADPNPETLWKGLEAYEEKTGGQVLAIAHNGNLSNGKMFELTQYDGSKITDVWSERRSRLEPLYEATQTKGDGEAHPFLSPDDEFADFETWDKGNLNLSVAKTNKMLKHEYVRSGLQLGIQIQNDVGVNPYQFGVIGSTDAHTGLAAVAEDNFFGKLPHVEPSSHRLEAVMMTFGDLSYLAADVSAAGYAGVWAKENTRRSIFDAMLRKETYATSGPRMAVRFFGGWDFTKEDAQTRQPARIGYAKGVPMGGKLGSAPEGKSPTFLVGALRDPIGANLDRYQIIKGWIDAKGERKEKVYNVAWSDNRQMDANGNIPVVGNTVDVKNAKYTNSIGASELIAAWTDPDFDPKQRAFYYGRVLEIPTPRWTAYDAVAFDVEIPDGVKTVTQDRAYTSAIWYNP